MPATHREEKNSSDGNVKDKNPSRSVLRTSLIHKQLNQSYTQAAVLQIKARQTYSTKQDQRYRGKKRKPPLQSLAIT
jgi:hypothetical protein